MWTVFQILDIYDTAAGCKNKAELHNLLSAHLSKAMFGFKAISAALLRASDDYDRRIFARPCATRTPKQSLRLHHQILRPCFFIDLPDFPGIFLKYTPSKKNQMRVLPVICW
jgi:hypothetical protein